MFFKSWKATLSRFERCCGLFLQCWAGLPPAILGPSVLSKGVETGPITTHFGPACAESMPPFRHTLITYPW